MKALSMDARGALIGLGAFAIFSTHDVVVKYLGNALRDIFGTSMYHSLWNF